MLLCAKKLHVQKYLHIVIKQNENNTQEKFIYIFVKKKKMYYDIKNKTLE